MHSKEQAKVRPGALRTDPATSVRLGRVRQQGTGAELTVRSLLCAMRIGYRVHNRDLPGSPDLANRGHRWAIFVHGCFWHSHEGCPRATVPKRNRTFWRRKFKANRARDEAVTKQLREFGYRVLVVWECELRDQRTVHTVASFFRRSL